MKDKLAASIKAGEKTKRGREANQNLKPRYWMGLIGDKDDFGAPIGDEFIDGKTRMGPWANMSLESWKRYGLNRLGLGWGQRYRKQADGKWLKVEG